MLNTDLLRFVHATCIISRAYRHGNTTYVRLVCTKLVQEHEDVFDHFVDPKTLVNSVRVGHQSRDDFGGEASRLGREALFTGALHFWYHAQIVSRMISFEEVVVKAASLLRTIMGITSPRLAVEKLAFVLSDEARVEVLYSLGVLFWNWWRCLYL
jgi:hypothetical protein